MDAGVTAAILGLVAAVTAASSHRQAWINALWDDLATFFTAIEDGARVAGNQVWPLHHRLPEGLVDPQKVVGRQSLSPTPHNFAADQTETAPRKLPLGSLNQTAR